MGFILKILFVLAIAVVALAGGAILKNGVPLTEPPGLAKRLATYLSRNTARTRLDHEFPELRSPRYALPRHRVHDLVIRAARDAGWRIIDTVPERGSIHAVVATPWLRFRDDVRISLEEGPDGSTLVQVESRSRLGRADFGANIAHVKTLHRRLDALAAAEP